MPVTVRGARGGITRALWLRMYAAACPGHACIGTQHSRGHWEGWIHLPNAEGMCVCVGCRSERGAAGVCCRRIGQSAPSIKNKKNSLACVCACALCLVGFLPTPPPELEFSYLPGCVDQAFLDAPKANKMRAGYLFGSRGVYFFLKKDHNQLRPAGAWVVVPTARPPLFFVFFKTARFSATFSHPIPTPKRNERTKFSSTFAKDSEPPNSTRRGWLGLENAEAKKNRHEIKECCWAATADAR